MGAGGVKRRTTPKICSPVDLARSTRHPACVTDRAPFALGDSGAVRTKRLILRRPTEFDVEALIRLRDDPAVRRYLGGPVSEDQALTKALGVIDSVDHVVADTASGDVAGLMSSSNRDEDVELSYEFFPSYWGHGLAREACGELVKHAVVAEPARLIAITQRSNDRSRRLLRVLGFRPREEFEEFGAAQVLYVHGGQVP